MLHFKIAHSPKGIFVYPTPVDKTRLYLIVASDLAEAETLKVMLESDPKCDPLTDARFKRTGFHSDGVTALLSLRSGK
ncbi:MAG: hypothetical protein K2P81_11775 [Bacteriovoracaceae bacterium]|nr:hypothetical protein [Bacteriovoracaceae bacterium]